MLEIVVDNFAGGGGASSGIEAAIGRPIDIAINHDIVAIRMHKVNHPHTKHYCESVWDVDPVEACAGRQVSLAWFSPDCKHFSKAKGGRPVDKKIRGLAWVALKWAAKVKPRVIILENVEEFITWGPLEKSEDGGYRPCTKKKGRTFTAFINALKRHGYIVDYTELRGCDYGAPTIRRRLFLVARSDGRSIIWPEPTHGDPKSEDVKSGRLKPWRVAAECIHWDLACPSIFERKRPLADATQRRIAKGIMKYAVKSPNPFIVTYYGEKHANDFRGQSLEEPLRTQTTENRHGLIVPYIAPLTHQGSDRTRDIREPFPVVTGAHRGELALVAPYMIRTDMHKSNAGCNYDSREPLRTVTSSGGHALVSAFLAKHYSGVIGSEMDTPVGTVTAIDHHSLVTAFLARHMGCSIGSDLFEPARTLLQNNKDSLVTSHIIKLKGNNLGQDPRLPLQTITAGGLHFGEVRAFLLKYYGTDQDPRLREPLHTITTRDRFGLVTVRKEEYLIVDIGMRMLTPRELFRAQGFPDSYIIEHDVDGKPFTKTEQVAKCGNSVNPGIAEALVRANVVLRQVRQRAAI